jgi:hypothetical protein
MAIANTLFAVLAVSDPLAVEKQLQSIAPWLYLKVAEGQWLLIAPAATTTKEISDRIGLTNSSPISNGIVLRAENYFGRNAASVWEWISTKQGAELGTAAPV